MDILESDMSEVLDLSVWHSTSMQVNNRFIYTQVLGILDSLGAGFRSSLDVLRVGIELYEARAERFFGL